MKPIRRRLHLRIAMLAMLALLWSQTALAWHAVCAAELPPAVAQAVAMQGHGSDCHQAPPPTDDDGLCAAHCDQDVPSPDTARIPALPAMPALVPALVAALTPHAPATLRRVDSPPPIAWHRPTAHPAALLLI
ncbi:hypothetical protein [Thermomonas mangrovi]|uniref:hypothetical protein n=1 Tax=Thermomonas mangrovi TaxID=2993316 RepID=UPI0023078A3C|nr:hypothetical protein [Thermomonas mangrovi]